MTNLPAILAGAAPPSSVILFGGTRASRVQAALDGAHAFLGRPAKSESDPDLLILEGEDGKAAKVEDARIAARQMRMSAVNGNRKACIIPRTEDLTAAAANALLKIIEEPPAGVLFILCAGHPRNVLPTLRSRSAVSPVSETRAERSIWTAMAGGDQDLAATLEADLGAAFLKRIDLLLIDATTSRLNRSALWDYADAYGKDDLADLALDALVGMMSHLTCVVAKAERGLESRTYPMHLPWTSLATAWEYTAKVRHDSKRQHLDKRYALIRQMIAVEHALHAGAP